MPTLRLLAAALAFASLVTAGCADEPDPPAAGSDVVVRPFAEVQASDLTFAADPADPTRGIFRVTTTEPMICAIVWGETDAFGRFNNSMAMNGTGIVDHDVALPDVVPGRTYMFVVQGTTADGTLYRSEPGTFTIPATTPPSPTTAVADDEPRPRRRRVDVSSEFGAAYAADNAIDGVRRHRMGDRGRRRRRLHRGGPGPSRRRSATSSSSPARWPTAPPSSTATRSRSTTSRRAARSLRARPPTPHPSPLDVTGQVVRIDVERSSGGNVGAVEIRLLAP